jgi:hypothetical protein
MPSSSITRVLVISRVCVLATTRICAAAINQYQPRHDQLKARVNELRKLMMGDAQAKLEHIKAAHDLARKSLAAHKCLLCHREVLDSDRATVAKMKQAKAAAEQQIADMQATAAGPKALEEAERDLHALDVLAPNHARFVQAEAVDIPRREADQRHAADKLAEAQEELALANTAHEQQVRERQALEEHSKEMAKLELMATTLKSSERELGAVKLKAAGDGNQEATPSSVTLQKERADDHAALERSRASQHEAQRRLDRLASDHEALKNASFESKDKVLSLKERLAEAEVVERKRDELIKQLEALQQRLAAEDYDMADHRKACDAQARRLDEFKSKADARHKAEQEAANALAQTIARLKDKMRAVDEVVGGADAQGDLEALTAAIDAKLRKRDALQQSVAKVGQELDAKKNMLDHNQTYQVRACLSRWQG